MDHTMLFYKVLCCVPAKPVKFSRQHGDGACTVLWGFHGSASSANVCCEKVTGVVRSLPLPLSPPPSPSNGRCTKVPKLRVHGKPQRLLPRKLLCERGQLRGGLMPRTRLPSC